MPASRRGLNALIAQCRRLEAELDGAGSRESTAMHRFVAEMDAHARRRACGRRWRWRC